LNKPYYPKKTSLLTFRYWIFQKKKKKKKIKKKFKLKIKKKKKKKIFFWKLFRIYTKIKF